MILAYPTLRSGCDDRRHTTLIAVGRRLLACGVDLCADVRRLIPERHPRFGQDRAARGPRKQLGTEALKPE